MTSTADMSDAATTDAAAPPAPTPVWTPAQKLAFRLLFTIGGGILILSVFGNFGLSLLWYPLLQALAQLGSVVTRGEGVHLQLDDVGDSLASWCYHLGWILVALLITAVWTVLDRRRPNYRSLAMLLFVFARFGLAISMLAYGLGKLIPAQMANMTLPGYQIQMVGDVSLMNTLWGFMGASDPYTMAAGLVEFVSGVLLLWRRTWLLGALIAIGAMGQVFLLNLFYDVSVKLVSGQLLLIAIAITTPYWRSLAQVVFQRGTPEPVTLWPALGSGTRWLRRTGTVAKFVIAGAFVVYMGTFVIDMVRHIHDRQSDLDGVWTATSFTIDGRQATLQQSSPAPWTNVAITDRGGEYTSFVTQAPAGYVAVYDYEIHDDRLELKKGESDRPIVLHFRQDGPDRLVLTGTVDGKQIEGRYERRFLQRSESHFRLVQPDLRQKPAGRLP
ncbi:hypothetical protein M2272_004914 [Mycobacterium frederiksbergense]|uniref:DoxX family protein n=1 Tax=Mycolicibacterium frederiksbergense TaxID=117567 RepID=A0ABT6L5P2_9MYCO|nr:hypothetical protein [Mycolicibacterium frederiksbergense]MDH6198255.1 hypothetical protein [Mycolicibacterium frederiksbergense]